jgi:hypothetical protein
VCLLLTALLLLHPLIQLFRHLHRVPPPFSVQIVRLAPHLGIQGAQHPLRLPVLQLPLHYLSLPSRSPRQHSALHCLLVTRQLASLQPGLVQRRLPGLARLLPRQHLKTRV